jgi:spermidine/putrescine transport system substrate-binding protein
VNPLSRRTLFVRAAVASSFASFLAACGDDETAEPGSAPATTGGSPDVSGTLNLLNFPAWAGPTTYADFATANPGASVNEIPYESADDSVAKAKDRSGDIDALLVDGTTFPRLTAIQALAELGSVPNMAAVAATYKGNSWDPDNLYFAPTDHGRTGIIYRKDLVANPITSWADFLAAAPDYSGKVAVLDYNRSVMGSIMRYLGKPSSSTEQADLDEALATLTALKPHLATIATEVGPLVADGTVVMAMADVYDSVAAIEANPNVVWVDPSEGQVGYLEGFAIVDGPRNDLARAFIDFFLDPKNYAAFVNTVLTPYVQPDNPDIDEKLKSSAIINPPDDVASNVEFHQFLGEAQAIWDTTWDAFKSA